MGVIPPQDDYDWVSAGDGDDMTWATLLFSREEVDVAGVDLASGDAARVEAALPIVNNWRSSHAFPLNTIQMLLRRNVGAVDPNALVAQRIKRLPAIAHKLERIKRLSLSELQDIGGCRAVLSTIDQVHRLRDRYSHSRMAHTLQNETDYLAVPRKTGYRGIHLIYEYRSDTKPEFNGLRVEMQIRSRLQHAWATAVETVGMFRGQYLKSNQGDKQWLRFFVLMSAAIAQREKAPAVPGAPTDKDELKKELLTISSSIDARNKLLSYGRALSFIEPKVGDFFLLKLTPSSGSLEIKPYSKRNSLQAQTDYLALERSLMGNPGVDAVLVSVDAVKHLRAAFPNYYLDTTKFVAIFDAATK